MNKCWTATVLSAMASPSVASAVIGADSIDVPARVRLFPPGIGSVQRGPTPSRGLRLHRIIKGTHDT